MITISKISEKMKNNDLNLTKDDVLNLFQIIPDAFNVVDVSWHENVVFIKGLNVLFDIKD